MVSRTKKSYSYEERETMVKTIFAVAIQNGEPEWLTITEIGRRLDMSRSPQLQSIIRRMLAKKILTRREAERAGKWPGYEYMLSPGTYERPSRRRSINLNAKGKSVGQLELFS